MLIHVVKPGESLWLISSVYRVPIFKIIDANSLQYPNQLLVGQALVIPTEDFIHIVKPGETLWKIAQSYGVTIQQIVQKNKMANPNNIFPGLILVIPAPQHTVQIGETLSRIASRYGVSIQTLIKVNNISSPNLIYPGMVLIIPQKDRPLIEVNGYTYQMGAGGAPVIEEVGEHLTYMSPFAYLIKEDGSLQEIADTPLVQAAYSEKVVPMMAITNFTYSSLGHNLAHEVLSTSSIRETLLTNILNIMREKGYRGLNIDFENVLPEDRELYNNFLQLAVDRLHPEGYFVSSALAPKTGPGQQGLLYTAHDYPAHGRILDFVVLMTYEWGYRLGPPRAISPINLIKDVVDYAVSVMPRNKIFFGFQIYARDWILPHVQGQEAETFDMQEAISRAVKYGASIQYDTLAQSPFFRYTDESGVGHEVWFEDARSAQAKFEMVKNYRLRGISYWALGYPYPQNWVLLEDNFTVKKLL